MSDEKIERMQGSLNGIGNLSVDTNRSMNAVGNLFQSVNPAPQDSNTGNSNTNAGNHPATPAPNKK